MAQSCRFTLLQAWSSLGPGEESMTAGRALEGGCLHVC